MILEPGHGFLYLAYSGRMPVPAPSSSLVRGPFSLQVQRVSTRVLAGAAQPCADLARDGVGLWERISYLRLRPDPFSEPWASRVQASLGRARGASPPLGGRRHSTPGPFARRAARACARSRHPARAALVVPRGRGAPLQTCCLTEPPPRRPVRRASSLRKPALWNVPGRTTGWRPGSQSSPRPSRGSPSS